MKVNNLKNLLKTLRWKEDMLVTNHFGEHVWLKPCFIDGKRIGITECCFADDPCQHHLFMSKITVHSN